MKFWKFEVSFRIKYISNRYSYDDKLKSKLKKYSNCSYFNIGDVGLEKF